MSATTSKRRKLLKRLKKYAEEGNLTVPGTTYAKLKLFAHVNGETTLYCKIPRGSRLDFASCLDAFEQADMTHQDSDISLSEFSMRTQKADVFCLNFHVTTKIDDLSWVTKEMLEFLGARGVVSQEDVIRGLPAEILCGLPANVYDAVTALTNPRLLSAVIDSMHSCITVDEARALAAAVDTSRTGVSKTLVGEALMSGGTIMYGSLAGLVCDANVVAVLQRVHTIAIQLYKTMRYTSLENAVILFGDYTFNDGRKTFLIGIGDKDEAVNNYGHLINTSDVCYLQRVANDSTISEGRRELAKDNARWLYSGHPSLKSAYENNCDDANLKNTLGNTKVKPVPRKTHRQYSSKYKEFCTTSNTQTPGVYIKNASSQFHHVDSAGNVAMPFGDLNGKLPALLCVVNAGNGPMRSTELPLTEVDGQCGFFPFFQANDGKGVTAYPDFSPFQADAKLVNANIPQGGSSWTWASVSHAAPTKEAPVDRRKLWDLQTQALWDRKR
jgi:hypothetical protein